MRRVNSKVDWNIWYSFVLTSNTISIIFNFLSYKFKVGENATLAVQEFSIFYTEYHARQKSHYITFTTGYSKFIIYDVMQLQSSIYLYSSNKQTI